MTLSLRRRRCSRRHLGLTAEASRRALRSACEPLEPRRLLASSFYDGEETPYGPQPATSPTAMAAAATPAQAVVTATAQASEPSATPTPSVVAGVVYSNMGGAATPTTVTAGGSDVQIGFDDYNTINDANLNLTSFRFIGGVSVMNRTLHFDFHDASDAFVTRVSANLGTAGDFIWTLTPPSGLNIPDVGFLHIIASASTTGTWYKGSDGPTVGTQDPALGSAGAGQSFKFEFTNTPINTAPTIASLSDSPDPVAAGGSVTLTANSVADPGGSIANVRFYRETNGVSGLQTSGTADLLLATDTVAPYTHNFSTVGLANATYTYHAQATDNTALVGAAVSTTNSVGFGSITGTVWNDANNNQVFDGGEATLSGWTVFLDKDDDQVLDAGETSTTSNPSGVYTFSNLAPDTYFVTTVLPAGWQQTFPGTSGQVSSTAAGGAVAVPGTAAVPSITTTGSTAPVYPSDDDGGGGGGGNVSPSDAQSNSLIRVTQTQSDPRFSNIKGQGFSVAVLDSGIDRNHPFFGPDADSNGIADRIVYQQDFANGDMDASDPTAGSGHGTNVASIVGSSSATYPGVAPMVSLIALKVFTDAGDGSFSFIEQALQWCVANAAAHNLAAVNMSLGDNENYNSNQALYGISDELAALAAQNVIVVSAAGNDFAKFDNTVTPQGVSYPAADANSLAVSAVYDADVGPMAWGSGAGASQDNTTAPDRITSFSQRSTTQTDIFAPGAMITGGNATGGITTMGGTSQASPHVAGIAALAQQLAAQKLGRRLTQAEFRSLMINTGVTIMDGDDENDNVVNTGAIFRRVDVLALAEAIRGMGTNPFTHTVNISAGESVTAVNFGNRSTDTTAPTADIVDISPDPRLTSVAAVTVNFSEPVTGVGASDFTLQRDGSAVNIAAATVVQVTPAQYTIDLAPFSVAAGKYLLTLNASGSGITDGSGNPLTVSASDEWIRNAVDGSSGNDTIRLVRSGGAINVFVNNATGTPTYAVNITNLGANVLHVQGLAGNDTINADFTGGVPAPSVGLNANGGSHSTADTLVLTGTAAAETATFTATNFNFGATTIAHTGVEAHTFNGGTGNDTLNVNGGVYNFNIDANTGTSNLAVNVASPAVVHFNASQHLAALTVNGNADLAAGASKVLVTKSLAVGASGKLNLRNHDLIIDYPSGGPSPIGTFDGTAYTGVSGAIQSAFNFGGWNGNGITTSEADALNGITTLGVSEAANALGLNGTFTDTWSGETVDATCVLIKYTYAADANLDGQVDAGDYGILDFFTQSADSSGFGNGDFNLDGFIDPADYGVIDFSIQSQGPPL